MPAATIRQCAILAGGIATRLGAIAATTPKPALEVGGRPFLAWLMRELLRFGIEEFLLLTGHLSAAVEHAVRAAAATLPREVGLRFSVEPAPAGTGGALYHARAALDERFVLCNGDSLFDCNFGLLLRDAARDGPQVAGRMLLRRIADASRYGVVSLEGDRVAAFHERPPSARAGIINAGVYVLDRGVLHYSAPACSLEAQVLPALAAAGRLRGTLAEGWFVDIGIPGDLARAREELPRRLRRPGLFLSRHGVPSGDGDPLAIRDRSDWSQSAVDAIRLGTAAGRHVFILADRADANRGSCEKAAIRGPRRCAEEARLIGGTVDDWRCLSRHTGGRGNPRLHALQDLVRTWELDPRRCLLVGDQASDLAAAAKAGMRGELFARGDLAAFVAPLLTG